MNDGIFWWAALTIIVTHIHVIVRDIWHEIVRRRVERINEQIRAENKEQARLEMLQWAAWRAGVMSKATVTISHADPRAKTSE